MLKWHLTQAHDDAVTESLWMAHQLIRNLVEVFQHLHRLGVLQYNMFSIAARLVERLVD